MSTTQDSDTQPRQPATQRQQFAQRALKAIQKRKDDRQFKSKNEQEYRSFAQSFPALVHQCGLAQAISFADAKGHSDFLNDLATTLDKNAEWVKQESRDAEALAYMHLSRKVMQAAEWLKRYCESILDKKTSSSQAEQDA